MMPVFPKLPDIIKFIVIFLLLFANVTNVYSEQRDQDVQVHIRVIEFGISTLDKKSEPVFKFYLGDDETTGKLLNRGGVCYEFDSKSGTESFVLPDQRFPKLSAELESFTLPLTKELSFNFVMECYENDKGEVCNFDEKDEFHSISRYSCNLNNFVPGDYSKAIVIEDAAKHFYCKVQLKYSLLPADGLHTSPALLEVNNAAQPLILKANYPLLNKQQLLFNWEYSLDGMGNWTSVGYGAQSDLSIGFTPLKDIFKDSLTITKRVWIRCKTSSHDTTSYSDTLVTSFTAPPPVHRQEDVNVTRTCPRMAVGGIRIANLRSSVDSIAWVLVKANQWSSKCAWELAHQKNCEGFFAAGRAKKAAIDIKNLPADSFVLAIFNAGLSVGAIADTIAFSIYDYKPLSSLDITQKNPTCFDYRGGEIVAMVIGGSSEESWQVELNPMAGTLERKPGQLIFRNLEEADYFVQVSDGCGTVVNKNVYLKKPTSLQIEEIRKVNAAGRVYFFKLKNGSGQFEVVISDKDQLQKKFDSSNLIIPFPIPGIWKIHIVDKLDPECVWVDTTIKVASLQRREELLNERFAIASSATRSETCSQPADHILLLDRKRMLRVFSPAFRRLFNIVS